MQYLQRFPTHHHAYLACRIFSLHVLYLRMEACSNTLNLAFCPHPISFILGPMLTFSFFSVLVINPCSPAEGRKERKGSIAGPSKPSAPTAQIPKITLFWDVWIVAVAPNPRGWHVPAVLRLSVSKPPRSAQSVLRCSLPF